MMLMNRELDREFGSVILKSLFYMQVRFVDFLCLRLMIGKAVDVRFWAAIQNRGSLLFVLLAMAEI